MRFKLLSLYFFLYLMALVLLFLSEYIPLERAVENFFCSSSFVTVFLSIYDNFSPSRSISLFLTLISSIWFSLPAPFTLPLSLFLLSSSPPLLSLLLFLFSPLIYLSFSIYRSIYLSHSLPFSYFPPHRPLIFVPPHPRQLTINDQVRYNVSTHTDLKNKPHTHNYAWNDNPPHSLSEPYLFLSASNVCKHVLFRLVICLWMGS